jgi:glyoxylase-like metal-dependent hydrolase (beta-lactamase superfamily II)
VRLHLLDARHLGRSRVICVGVLAAQDGSVTLIDPGPASVFPQVQEALRKRALEPRNVKRILVTHVHLDHSGGAWAWAKTFGSRVFAHPRGTPHLRNPDKLVASATRIYGGQMSRLWGSVEPIESALVTELEDGQTIACDQWPVQALATPGHAKHHHCFWISDERLLFAGDVSGVTIDGGPVFPPCPPPDIDVEAWKDSLNRLRALVPGRVVVTHFGEIPSPIERMKELASRLERWAEWIGACIERGESEETFAPAFCTLAREELRASHIDDDLLRVYEQADPAKMSVAGLARYWRKFRQAPRDRSSSEKRDFRT